MVFDAAKRPRVAFISQPEYFRFMYENDLADFADVVEFKLQISKSAEHYADLISYQAEYNFFFRGEYIPDRVLTQLTGHKIALSSEPFPRIVDGKREYTRDSLNRYLFFRSIRNKAFDYLFHYDAASLPFMDWDGLEVSGEFAFPVATSVFKPQPCQPSWDIFFIGRSTTHREHYFGLLKHHYNFLHICHGIWGPSLVDYLCAAKVCLNVHAENETSWEPRMQMMLACGVFVVSERITPNSYLRPGIDFIEVDGALAMYQAVEHYLYDDEARAKISRSGYERVHQILDSSKCFRELIEGIHANRFRRFSTRPGASALNGLLGAQRAWTSLKSKLR